MFPDAVAAGRAVAFMFQGQLLAKAVVVYDEVQALLAPRGRRPSPHSCWSLVLQAVVEPPRPRASSDPGTRRTCAVVLTLCAQAHLRCVVVVEQPGGGPG